MTQRQTVGLLISRPVDRHLLQSFLSDVGIVAKELTLPDVDGTIGPDLSLVIADEQSARRHRAELLALKWRLGVTMLPLLILLHSRGDSTAWLNAGFDDILRMPVTKAELHARLQVFLRLRGELDARYHTVIDHLLVGVYRATPAGEVLMANPAFEHLVRAQPEAANGSGIPTKAAREYLEQADEVIGLETEAVGPDGGTRYWRENIRAMRDADGTVRYYEGTVEDITARKAIDVALHAADQRAVAAYEELLERLSKLAQVVGTAEDLAAIFRALWDFVMVSTPSIGIFASLYDPETHLRRCVYAWSEGEEIDPATLPPMPLNDSPQSRAVITGEVIIIDDLEAALAGISSVLVGGERDPREPQSSVAVPMTVLGRVIGAFEVQSTMPAAYRKEHVIALRMAANLAAIAVENVLALERERVERQRTQASEERFRALVQHATDIIAVIDAQNVIQYVSPSVKSVLDFQPSDFVGKSGFLPLHDDDMPDAQAYFGTLIGAPGASNQIELRARHRDGSWRVLDIVGTNLLGDPSVRGVVINARDITERVRADEAIRRLNAELEQRVMERTAELVATNQELEAFSYSVSHDLRAPLRAIDGLSQIMLEDFAPELSAPLGEYLGRVRAASQRMSQLIDALLDLARVTRGVLRREPVDLSALAEVIVAELRQREPERVVDVAIAPGLIVSGDSRLLRVVLENLLGNAWKFTGKHSRACIEVGIDTRGSTPTYFVRDDGAGFDAAYAAKLFGAFQRLHSTAEFEGTGIGLATVQRIIHRHGGRIWATGAVEQGATFFFTLRQDTT
jgi:PAS domain S-box-containing protein